MGKKFKRNRIPVDRVTISMRILREEYDFCKDNGVSMTGVFRNSLRDMMAGGSVLQKSELEQIRERLAKRIQTMSQELERCFTDEEYKQYLERVERGLSK